VLGYDIDGQTFPAVSKELRAQARVYETLPGWMTETEGITDYDDLPEMLGGMSSPVLAYRRREIGFDLNRSPNATTRLSF